MTGTTRVQKAVRAARQAVYRDAILAAGEEAFATHGYEAAHMQSIAERAGLSVGVLYATFDGKASLFREIQRVRTETLIERTRDIVDSLKRFSAIDRDEMQPFNLTQVIERAVHWVAKAAAADRFKVDMQLPEGINVLGSSGQMQQVLMNLVQNACDATADVAHPRLEIRARRVDDTVEVCLRDNGPGIDPASLAHVFEPFFTTKAVGKGTGLGLAISYGIVERHGGTLTAANHPDGGAVFCLTLPLAHP